MLMKKVSDYMQEFMDSKALDVMVYLYIDMRSLSARCVSSDVPVTGNDLQNFARGFTQAQPLFHIVDVGPEQDKLYKKIEGI